MIRWAAGRPSVVWALAAGLVLAGGVAFSKLPLATKTEVDLPRISVSASWPGASPELTESYITSPIEAAIQGVRGVRKTSSRSNDRGASITVELDPTTDVTMARLAILERMETLRADLPDNARGTVRVSNWVPEDLDEQPLLQLSVVGSYTPGALTRIAEDRVQPRLESVEGVSGVSLNGRADNGVAVTYDATRLRQLGIPATALTTALNEARVVRGLGVSNNGSTERTVLLRDQPHAIEDLGRVQVRASGNRVFALSELATIRPEEDSRGFFYRINGHTAVSFSLERQAGADAIKTAARARAVIAELRQSLPPGVTLRIDRDQSIDLARELKDLLIRGVIAFTAVLVVLVLTLRSVPGGLQVIGSAAVAIAGTALSLYLLDIPANLLTLAGLAMGIGILVQNGLVVVERLRHVTDSSDAKASAARRILPAVVGSTLTTAVVLFPFLYLQGNARAAFVPCASAFSLALAWSVFAAMIMLPAVAKGGGGDFRGWPWLARAYDAVVRRLMRWRYATMVFTLGAIVFLAWGFKEKVPKSNWGFGGWWGGSRTTVSANVTFPRGSDPEQVDRMIRELEQVAVGRDGVALVRASGRPDGGGLVVEFTPEAGKGEPPWIISDELTQRAVLIGGATNVHVSKPEGPGYNGGSGGSSSISKRVKILGYSFEGVRQLALNLQQRLERIPRVREVNINAGSFWGSEKAVSVALTPDRIKLGQIGATAADFGNSVAREVQGASGSQRLEIGDDEYNVALRSAGANQRQLLQLSDAFVSNESNAPVRIGDVASVSEVEGLATIEREDQQYIRILTYDFRGPQKLADRTHKAFMGSITVPAGYSVADDDGRWAEDESAKGLYLVFAAGVLLVLLSVAMVFDSTWAALMVFISLPIAVIGGVVPAFWISGTAFTREAAVGVILVVGLAVNQAIMLIDAVLATSRRAGRRVNAADIVRATRDRSTMIVLVTLTTLASLVPMAWGEATDTMFGAIALATAGGTVAGTIGAMFLMPPILLGFRRTHGRRRKGPPKGPGFVRRMLARWKARRTTAGPDLVEA